LTGSVAAPVIDLLQVVDAAGNNRAKRMLRDVDSVRFLAITIGATSLFLIVSGKP
jgi:hypothetical protein